MSEKGLGPPEAGRAKQTTVSANPPCTYAGSPLDHTVIESIRALQQEDMPDILSELIQIYLSESKNQMQILSQAAAHSDPEGICKTAHSLKSSSGNMGATTLASLFRTIEEKAKRQETQQMMDDYNLIFVGYQRVQSALEEMMRESKT